MLELKNVSKSYGKNCALNNVSVKIPRGSCFALIGPNGAGKSTLMKIIAGIIKQDAGKVHFDNAQNCHSLLGYVPQDICLEENVSAQRNLCHFGSFYQLKGKMLQNRAEEILHLIGLSKQKNDKVKTFSGGMKRRLNIGCALMHQPQILLLDEPTVGIDPQSRKQIMQLIAQLREDGRTIIYSTHYLEEAEKLCDQVALIDHGEIVVQSTMAKLLEQHSQPSIYFAFAQADMNTDQLQEFGQVRTHQAGYIIQTNHPMQVFDALLSICNEQGTELQGLEFVKSTLEDVFFRLADSKLKQGGNSHAVNL